MRTGKLWAAFRPYLWITLASAVFALGFDWCYVPNQITLGGMTGLGQIIHAIVPAIPVGSAVIALNLPLFLLGWRLLGWKLLASSLFATAATSLGVDLLAACYSFPPMDPMLASVFGGALIGLSLGMVFLQGATTGGTDLIARLLKLRFGHLPMGTLVMAVDLVVIALAALAFHSLSSALYGLVSLYISSLVIDRVLTVVANRYNQDLTLSDVAEQVHLTPNYVGALFKSVVGESFVDYLTRYRMERAKELHDDLEAEYVAAMDFEKLDALCQQVLDQVL